MRLDAEQLSQIKDLVRQLDEIVPSDAKTFGWSEGIMEGSREGYLRQAVNLLVKAVDTPEGETFSVNVLSYEENIDDLEVYRVVESPTPAKPPTIRQRLLGALAYVGCGGLMVLTIYGVIRGIQDFFAILL